VANKRILSVSLLSADFSNLTQEIQTIEQSRVSDIWFHIDVMDGHFVPEIQFGANIVRAIRKITNLPLDIHLMVNNPDRQTEIYANAGASWLSVHVETCLHLYRTIQDIKKLHVNAGVVLNPATPFVMIEPVIDAIDMVLAMTVEPGFSNQKFIPSVLPKIRELRRLIDKSNPSVLLAVDGESNLETIEDLVALGVDVFVAGSTVFDKGNHVVNIKALKAKTRD